MTRFGFSVLEIKQQLAEQLISEEKMWESLYGETRSGAAIEHEAARNYAALGSSIEYLRQCLGEVDPEALTITLTGTLTPWIDSKPNPGMHEVAFEILKHLKRDGHNLNRVLNDTEYSQLFIHAPADMAESLNKALEVLEIDGSVETADTPNAVDLFNWNMAREFLDANPVEIV